MSRNLTFELPKVLTHLKPRRLEELVVLLRTICSVSQINQLLHRLLQGGMNLPLSDNTTQTQR